MIERIARRTGGFASTTALRWIRAVRESVPDVELSHPKKPNTMERLRKPLTTGALAGGVVLVSSNKGVRGQVAKALRNVGDALRADASSPRRSNERSPAPGSGHQAGHGAAGNGAGNGAGRSLSKKTRAELYEMAKKKDIPGRSTMSKQELAKALGTRHVSG